MATSAVPSTVITAAFELPASPTEITATFEESSLSALITAARETSTPSALQEGAIQGDLMLGQLTKTIALFQLTLPALSGNNEALIRQLKKTCRRRTTASLCFHIDPLITASNVLERNKDTELERVKRTIFKVEYTWECFETLEGTLKETNQMPASWYLNAFRQLIVDMDETRQMLDETVQIFKTRGLLQRSDCIHDVVEISGVEGGEVDAGGGSHVNGMINAESFHLLGGETEDGEEAITVLDEIVG